MRKEFWITILYKEHGQMFVYFSSILTGNNTETTWPINNKVSHDERYDYVYHGTYIRW